MSSHTEPIHDHPHAHDHSGAPALYLRTLIMLLILTVITVAAAGIKFSSSSVNVVIALTIASIKAILVALFFMHLKSEKSVNSVIATAGFLFLGIFLMFCLIDADSRGNLQPVNLRPPLPPPTAAPAAGAPPAAGATPTAAAPGTSPASPPAAEKK